MASKLHFQAILAVAIITLLCGAPMLAQANTQFVGSDISLVVDGGAEVAVMPVITETAQSDLLTYDFLAGEVQFATGVVAPDYDEPLFCFDMGTSPSAVSLRATDPNGHVIIDNFDLDLSLEYVLSAPSSLVLQPSSNQHCFYRSGLGVFGLFGMEAPDDSGGGDVIARDRFEPDLALTLEYQNVPTFATQGETIEYDLVLSNTGTADLEDVALQELYPQNVDVYAAGLSAGTWTCSASGDAVCPGASANADSLRFEQMNSGGIDITAGDSLTFSIERTVDANSIAGESILLQSGTVSNAGFVESPFAVAEALVTVIGQSAGLDVSATTATVNNEATITVTVLDGNQNPVPGETVNVDNDAGLSFGSTSGVSDTNGEVVFTAETTTAGDYSVSFTTGSLNGNGIVTFEPGAPEEMVVWTAVDGAVADGSDTIEIRAYVEDQWQNPIPALTVDVVEDGGLVSLPAFASTDSSGTASFFASSTEAESYSVEIGVSGLGSEVVSVAFVSGEPDDFAFMTQPSDTPEGGVMNSDITIRVVDANGNWVEDNSSIEITLQLRLGGSTIDTLGFQTVQNGETTFSNPDLDVAGADAGTGYYLRAFGTHNGNAILESSDPFEITPVVP